MSKPTRCEEGGAKAVVPKVLETYSTDLDRDGRAYRVKVPNLAVYQCTVRGAIEMDTDAVGRIFDAFRLAVGVSPAVESRRRRKELGLTQEAMASLPGVAVSTRSRWETRAQMQQRRMDNMLRAFFDVPALRDFLGRRDARLIPLARPAALRPKPDGNRKASTAMASPPSLSNERVGHHFAITAKKTEREPKRQPRAEEGPRRL